MARVFLSYDRRDAGKAEAIAKALAEAGHSVWWDRHIKGGRRFRKEIEQALGQADAVVVLWSANSIESDWVQDEAATGRDDGRLIPVALDESVPPLGFRQFQTIALSETPRRGNPGSISALLDAIDALCASGRTLETVSLPTLGPIRSPTVSRRSLLIGVGGAAALAGGGLAYWRLGNGTSSLEPRVAALLDQAWQSWAQGTSEGNSQAIGLYRRATAAAPEYADAWGFLGCAYGDRGHNWVGGAERDAVWQRAQEAGRRALELDPENAYGRAAIAYARPLRGNWALMEREFRQANEDQPGKWLIIYSLALLMGDVGRFAEAARLFGSLQEAPTATQYLWHVQALWASAQPGEAERLLDEAFEIFGTSSSIWWQRFDMLLSAGRTTAAIAHLEDSEARPVNLDDELLKQSAAVARASLSRNPAVIDAVVREVRDQAFRSVSWATRAILNASLLGATQVAMQLAEALYFSRGFSVPDTAASPEQSTQVTLDERRTRLLFLPPTKSLRQHPRFPQLVEELGLNRYWRESDSVPDYRRR